MKKEIGVVLLCLVGAAAPVLAQAAVPPCGTANFDQSRYVFTVINPVADAVNQQCLLTVYKKEAAPALARDFPALYPLEGNYVVEISGGGGGGGGGAANDKGGGGGAGAAPSRSLKYLSAGVYKLTIGTGGSGGMARGGRTEAGNPSSLTDANGKLVAGFPGADVWSQRSKAAGDGSGGVGAPGGSTGGSGGDKASTSTMKGEKSAQTGSASATSGYTGVAGKSGAESGRTTQTNTGTVVQANAGGGGGAGVGSGGAGASVNSTAAAGAGMLGAGGGGGHGGGAVGATDGGNGGHGFIRLIMSGVAL